jgi:hypothetical protein
VFPDLRSGGAHPIGQHADVTAQLTSAEIHLLLGLGQQVQ